MKAYILCLKTPRILFTDMHSPIKEFLEFHLNELLDLRRQSANYSSERKSTNFFCKGPDSKYS